MSHDRGYHYLDPAALARVKNLSLVARGVVEGFISGLHKSPSRGFSVEFAEHRKYTVGDNLRHLDWRVLGRTDRLYIKQFEEETNLRVQVLLDISGSMAYGAPPALTKFEYASYLTAVLAYLMMRQQDAVGLTAFDTEVRLELPARSSPRHFDEMMTRLEALRPGQTTNLGATLHRLAGRFKRRCLIVLISDLYEEPEAVDRALHHFHRKRDDVIVFQVLDRAEIDFPFRETASFIDMETGERLQVDPAYARAEYCRQVEEFLDRCRRSCADCQFDHVLADTSVPLDYMLSRYLEARRRR